jgi:hypothetical protein
MNQLQQNIESLEYQNQVFRRRLQKLSSLVETGKLAEFLASQGVSCAEKENKSACKLLHFFLS